MKFFFFFIIIIIIIILLTDSYGFANVWRVYFSASGPVKKKLQPLLLATSLLRFLKNLFRCRLFITFAFNFKRDWKHIFSGILTRSK